jgi:hypothetical protein
VVENISTFKYVGTNNAAEMVILRDGSVGPLFTGSVAGDQYTLDGVSFRCGPSGKHGCP